VPLTPSAAARIASFRELLESRQRELQQLLDNDADTTRPVTLDQQAVGRVSRIDAIQQQQMALANQQQSKALLKQIAVALRRIESGEFGDCLHCGEAIADARLQVQPWANLCIACQSVAEDDL
jgi:DnaK suppressor protein